MPRQPKFDAPGAVQEGSSGAPLYDNSTKYLTGQPYGGEDNTLAEMVSNSRKPTGGREPNWKMAFYKRYLSLLKR